MIDLLIVLAFVVYAVAAGLRARRKASRGLEEYFLAGRRVAGWKAGLSMAATQYAADTPLLVTGLVATGGLFLMWRFWIYGFGYLLLGLVFAELWRRAGVLTDAELTEVRYSGRGVLALRVLKAIYYGTVVNCFFLAIVLIAAVRIAEVFLPWHLWLPEGLYGPVLHLVQAAGLSLSAGAAGLDPATATANALISIVAIVAFVYLYSATGGLRGVVATDVVQFALAMIGTTAYAWFVVEAVGGLGALGERMVERYGAAQSADLLALAPTDGGALFPFLMLIGLQGLFWISSDGTGYLAQRAMACRSNQDARVAGVVFAWAQILVRSLIWLVIGVGLLVLYPFSAEDAAAEGFAAARELTFVTGIDDLLPVGFRGIMLTGLLAALASTVDTHLNWGASYWSRDLYERLLCQAVLKREPRGHELVLVARLSNLVVLAIAVAIMVNLGSIQATWFVSLVFGAGIGAVLMLRWLWERINLYAEVASILVSMAAAPLVIFWVEAEWVRLGLMVLLSTGAAVGTAYVTPATKPDVLYRFYAQVRPMGWWPQMAARAGDAPHAPLHIFGRRLRLMLLTTASLFLMLIGAAKLLVLLPDVRPVWAWGCLFGGAALIPVWWRSLFGIRRRKIRYVRPNRPAFAPPSPFVKDDDAPAQR